MFFQGLEDESSNCTRQTLIALSICTKFIIESEICKSITPVVRSLPLIAKNPYWLVKVKLAEFLSELNYVTIYHIFGSSDFQNKVVYNVFFALLKDDDQRVRTASAGAIVR